MADKIVVLGPHFAAPGTADRTKRTKARHSLQLRQRIFG
jgi:hypothetical protein